MCLFKINFPESLDVVFVVSRFLYPRNVRETENTSTPVNSRE